MRAAPAEPWRFCYGLQDRSNLALITEFGLNALHLELTPADVLDPQPQRELIRAARQRGLKVIVGLPTLLTPSYRVSPHDERYCHSVREVIASFVTQLKDEPGLTAWATASSLERRLDFDDADFRAYLQRGYASLDALNAQWGSRFRIWPAVTMAQARQLDEPSAYKIGPAAIDLANYQVEAYRQVMELWLSAIREHDDRRPVLTGRVTLYRSLVSIPDGYETVCVSMPPDVLEADLQAHNPQALDLARRGGKFRVLPVFRVPSNASPAYATGGLHEWAQHAALHGAVGFGLEDWQLLSQMYEIERRSPPRSRRLVTALQQAAAVDFDFTPQPTVAVVYAPYASGFDVTRQPVYGYLLDYLPGEPSNLIYALRLGMRYGGVDYLSVADLPDLDLDRYGCVLAPACLTMPAPQAGQLEQYVHEGGALLADLGLGAYQTRSWVQLPEALQHAFGIVAMGQLKERLGELTAAEGLRALSPWPRGMKATGLFSSGSGASASANELRSYPVSGWVAEAQLQENTAPVATLSVRFDKDKRPLFAGLVGREHGSGLALYATHPLWQYWPLTDPLSELLHAQLMARRAKHELTQSGLLQSGPFFSGGDGEVALYNPAGRQALAQVWAYAAGSHAYSSAASHFTAAPGTAGLSPGTALLVAAIPAKRGVRLRQTGLIVQPHSDDVTVEVREYTPQRMALRVAGAGCIVRQVRDELDLQGGEAVAVRLILAGGAYPVAAHSRHQVVVRARSKDARVVLTASARGELDLSDIYRNSTITITPATQ